MVLFLSALLKPVGALALFFVARVISTWCLARMPEGRVKRLLSISWDA